MEYQIGWSSYLMETDGGICSPLVGEITCDMVVVGGGMAGLFAAKTLIEAGKDVVLIEKSICGGGMSGRSGGFLTPDSELGLRQIEERYGKEAAKQLREYGQGGQDAIVSLAREEKFNCDLQSEDSLLLGWKKGWDKEVRKEFEARQEYGYEGEYVPHKELYQHTEWRYYSSAVRYNQCFAINPMVFCQEMKQYLLKKWVKIYENTTIQNYTHNYIKTSRGSVHCNSIIFAVGKVPKKLHADFSKDTYGLQNFITMSEPLTEDIVNAMFPQGKLMCWDTKLAFTYFRFTGDNRLVLGWWNMFTAGLPFDILHFGMNRMRKAPYSDSYSLSH